MSEVSGKRSKSKESKRVQQKDEGRSEGGQKRKHEDDEETEPTVQSANDWEHADLGDDSRKSKFLRLMGAVKKDHHGKIVIGEKKAFHGRSKEDTEKLSEELEEQYKQGIEMKVSGQVKRHAGLGFHDNGGGGSKEHEERRSSNEEDPAPKRDSQSPNEREKLEKTKNSSGESKPAEKKFGLFVKSSDQ